MSFKRIASSLVTLLLLITPVTLLWQRQNIYDWWVLRSYEPPTAIVTLATDTTMSDKGRTIFYVTKPALQTKSDFREACTSAEKTIVLGCYKSGSGIFVYDVTDPRLAGVQQVTAAHEMLHAAYERLSRSEKTRIDKLTADAYDKLTDERIKKNVEAYRERDAKIVPNELHSILGTEVKSLSSELEEHYAKYFTSRQKVVTYSLQYEAEFSKREAQVAEYDKILKTLGTDIDARKASLEAQAKVIDAESDRLDALLAAGKIPEYNAGIPNYKRLVDKYNADVDVLRAKITEYNSIVEARNAVVVEEQDLFKAIDTRVPTTKE